MTQAIHSHLSWYTLPPATAPCRYTDSTAFERNECMNDFFEERHLMMQQMQAGMSGNGEVMLGDHSEWSANREHEGRSKSSIACRRTVKSMV